MAIIKARQVKFRRVRGPKRAPTPVKRLAHVVPVSSNPRGTENSDVDYHYLRAKVHCRHLWRVDRRLHRSQSFVVWADPFGCAPEHWVDPDRLNAATPTDVWPVQEGFAEQYGDVPTDPFTAAARP